MHLKSYPKLIRSELRLNAASVQMSSQRSSLFVSQQQRGLLRTVSSNHISKTRLPFSFISTNMLPCNNMTSLCLKLPCNADLQPPGSENIPLESCHTTADDPDALQNMWTVIKPGHVREKIAIFTSGGRRVDRIESSKHTSTNSLGNCGKAVMTCTNSSTLTGMSRAVKAKGSWEESSSAKRRRRSGNDQNFPENQRTRLLNKQQHDFKPAPVCLDPSQQTGDEQCELTPVTAEEEQKVSVVEMVAILEQRASQLQPDLKPLLTVQRSSTTITLSKLTRPEVREDESDTVKVSEMVAKLESECLRRMDGGLSRSNSLRRTVGRVLLAAGEQKSLSSPSSSSPSGAHNRSKNSPSSSPKVSLEASVLVPSSEVTPPFSGELGVDHQEVVEKSPASSPQCEEQEPLPGLLFVTVPPDKSGSDRSALHYKTSFYKDPAPSHTLTCDSASQSERRSKEPVGVTSCFATVPLGRSGSASQDFLEIRQRLQQLLAPQPYLAVLPHHLLVKIFLLLPTQSLAALKCTCSYFKFIIETYSVRPADSLWVSDRRYRDDPCKQCKKRYCPGDVSLCRWHHKPYCQALPYGPGYWMCCHGAHRDAPGCNVGLHDNRWVPVFHSINVPIYKRNFSHDD